MGFDRSVGYFWINLIVTFTATAITLILTCIHTYNTISDLCTKSRKSLSGLHKSRIPERTTIYKTLMVLNCAAVILFFLVLGSITMRDIVLYCYYTRTTEQYSYNNIYLFNKLTLLVHIWVYWIGKLFMWYVFLIKLELAYRGSVYAYSSRTILIVAVVITVHTLVVLIFFTFDQKVTVEISNDEIVVNVYVNIVIICIAMGSELVMNIVYLYAFIRPLQLLMKSMLNHSHNNKHSGHSAAYFLHIGIKLVVLTSMAAISTICGLIFAAIANGSGLVGRVDVIINCICLMFNTLYYPNTYYHATCCLIVKCCNAMLKIKESYYEETSQKSKTSKNSKTSNKDIVDSTSPKSNTSNKENVEMTIIHYKE
eukprot:32805_1